LDLSWELPIPLDYGQLPKFPIEGLPEPIKRFFVNGSEHCDVEYDQFAVTSLAAISTSVQKKFCIETNAPYCEPLAFWGLISSPSGSRKSSVQAIVLKPIQEWERDKRKEESSEIKRINSSIFAMDARIKELHRLSAKSDDPDERKNLLIEIDEIEAGKPELRSYTSVLVEDVTPECLSLVMRENSGRTGVFSAEGSGFFEMARGRYSGEGTPQLGIYLKSYSGESVRVNRLSRDPISIDSAVMSICLAVQPEILRDHARQKAFRYSGLWARFCFSMPPHNIGERTLRRQPLDEGVLSEYGNIVKTLLDLPLSDQPTVLRLSAEAQALWDQFWHDVEHQMKEGHELASFRDWGAKLPGATARIAGLLHLIRYAYNQNRGDLEVGELDMVSAIKIGFYFKAHTLAVFDSMGSDNMRDKARGVLAWLQSLIKRGDPEPTITRREIQASHQSRFGTAKEVDEAMSILIEHGYLSHPFKQPTKGRPSVCYRINPHFYK